MTLVALLFAHHGAAGSTEPRAAIEVAGLSVVERQAMLARQLGAERLLVVAERMPPGLAGALSRLPDAEVVRNPTTLATELGADDRVLTLEEGLIVDPLVAQALVEAPGARLAVKAGDPPYPGAERVDSARFWAGLALYDGRFVRTVAADIGEWDLQSTLLRSAVGEGVAQVELTNGANEGWHLIAGPAAARDIEARMIAAAEPARAAWPTRYLYPKPARLLIGALLTRDVTGRTLALVGTATALLAVHAFALGWPGLGLVLALLAPFLTDAGIWLGRVRLEPAHPWAAFALDYAIEPAWYLALAYGLSDRLSPTAAFALAAALIAFRIAGQREARMLDWLGGPPAADDRLVLHAAGRETLLWALAPFALVGEWAIGLAAIAAYAAASFFAWQQRTLARIDKTTGVRL